MNELIFLVEEAAEGGFIARALGHSIFTEAETLEELCQQVKDAVQCHFDESQRPKGYPTAVRNSRGRRDAS